MAGMHQIAVKFVAVICFTASLYAFIAFSPNNWNHHSFAEHNKIMRVPIIADDGESVEHKCCQTLTTSTPTATTTLSTTDLKLDKTEMKFKYLMDSFVIGNSDINQSHQSHQSPTMSCVNHLSMIFTVTDNNVSFDQKLHQSLLSVLKRVDSASNLCIHLITDTNSHIRAKKIIEDINNEMPVKAMVIFYFHSISAANSLIEYLLPTLKRHFSYKPNSYYSHSLFFVSLVLHRLFDTIDKIVLLDIDVQLNDRFEPLFHYFSKFGPQTIIGIAYEQQPVYRHVLHDYRHTVNNQSFYGSPPSNGMPGFNSGVLLMHLKKMRESKLYNSLLMPPIVDTMCNKYLFRGHLGDQDFYTIISFDYLQLFYIIPCYWNRQLCQWWRYHGYEHVFDQYNRCDSHIKLFHGNCNAALPNYNDAVH